MRVFVAGANGAVGRRLVPMLVANGHQVTGTTTERESPGAVRAMGAEPVVVDGLDAVGIGEAVAARRARCDHPRDDGALGHARLPPFRSLVRADEPASDRGHRPPPGGGEGERRAGGSSRRASPAGATAGRARWIKTEEDPLDPAPGQGADARRSPRSGILERAVLEAPLEGIVVRYGGLYGPGSSETLGGDPAQADVPGHRQRRRASFRRPTSTTPQSGTLAALERGRRGHLQHRRRRARAVPGVHPGDRRGARGAQPPLHIPAWLGRLLAGEVAVTMMTEGRGSSNAKAKRELGWQPIWPSWRDGFRHGLDTPVPLPAPRAADDATGEASVRRDADSSTLDDVAEAYRRPPPAAVLDRLPDARRASARRRTSSRRRSSATSGRVAGERRVESPKAYLSAVVTRLAIDQLKSARVRRETYVGEWLPEPLVTDDGCRRPGAPVPSRRTRCRCRSCSCSSG